MDRGVTVGREKGDGEARWRDGGRQITHMKENGQA